MKRILLVSFIAFLAIGLYAQEKDTAQAEPEIKLELIWEKEIPEGVSDFVFLDENGYNVFSSQCKNPEKALKEKRILIVQDGKLKWLEGDEMKMTKEIPLQGGHITISKNGRNIAAIEGLERDPSGKGGFADKPATLRLYNWKGEELARTQISPGAWEYIHLYPLGNDRTIAMSKVGGEGTNYQILVFVKKGNLLSEIFKADGQYPTGHLDYAEDGSAILFLHTAWEVPIENRGKFVNRIIVNGEGKELASYTYQHPGWAGWVSPRGNYLVEVTRGKYLVIRNRNAKLIAEHHVQGQGNYYATFSPDEKYLCVTPGPWRVYFFETETGKMLWEYVDTLSHYRSIAISPKGECVFLSSTIYHPTSFTVAETADKSITIFDYEGQLLKKSIVASVKTPEELEFYRWKSVAPPLRITPDGKFLLVRLPNRLLLYNVVEKRR